MDGRRGMSDRTLPLQPAKQLLDEDRSTASASVPARETDSFDSRASTLDSDPNDSLSTQDESREFFDTSTRSTASLAEKSVPISPGMQIGRYELIRPLGQGGMGIVYLARDTILGRRVAIKFLHSDSPKLTKRFIVEARATARCHHENIVVIHEVGEYRNYPFMVLEYLRGQSLSRMLAGQVLPYSRAVELIVPVVRALVSAHQQNIVHRDLKPDNIFVTESGAVKVLDFGIAKVLEFRAVDTAQPSSERIGGEAPLEQLHPLTITQQGDLIGTLPFMSPEQWGAGTIDHRTDIWAIGIILYLMLTGQHPLTPLNRETVMTIGLLELPMPSIRNAGITLPDKLAEVVDRCLLKRKEHRIASARELLDALLPHLPGRYGRELSAGESPYTGLSPFQEVDANRFFGRSREVASLLGHLRDRPLVGVIGPSGVGKSSLIRAGVIPALKATGEAWETLILRPGRHPISSLSNLITSMLSADARTLNDELSQHQSIQQRLHAEPGYLGTLLRSRARRLGSKLLLFVDQFEELYTLGAEPAERMVFADCLTGVADDPTTPLRVIISLRSDFLDRVAESRELMADLRHSLFILTSPDRDGLREALVQPAEMVGYQYETPAMVERMLDSLASTPTALPLLQFTAAKLWEHRDTQRRLLTDQSYDLIGGTAGALASHADAVLAGLSPRAQMQVRALFQRLVTPERTRSVASLAELCELSSDPDEVQQLIEHLVDARLLIIQNNDQMNGAGAEIDGSISVEIIHESLLHSWPILRRWLEEDQENTAFLNQLRVAARQWQTRGRPAGLLWRGEALEEAQRWYQHHLDPLSSIEQEYMDAVLALGRRTARLKRLGVTATIAVLSLLVAVGAVALVLIRNAEQQATQEAAVARAAERTIREQLEVIKTKEQARQEAQQRAHDANTQVAMSREELASTNEELRTALTEAKTARDRMASALNEAERAKDEAERAKGTMAKALTQAEAANDSARRANKELEQLLDRERQRVELLERQLGGKAGKRLR